MINIYYFFSIYSFLCLDTKKRIKKKVKTANPFRIGAQVSLGNVHFFERSKKRSKKNRSLTKNWLKSAYSAVPLVNSSQNKFGIQTDKLTTLYKLIY